MRKILSRAMALLIVGSLAVFLTAPASAQSGVQGTSPKAYDHNKSGKAVLGIMGGFASYNSSGYASVYFQYRFASHVRIAPEIGCVFRNHDKSALLINADMHFPFRLSRGFNIYPLAGLTFNNWSERSNGNMLRLGADAGAGFDLYFTDNLKMNIQAKYSIMKDCSGTYVGLGLGYIF